MATFGRKREQRPGQPLSGFPDDLEAAAQKSENWAEAVLEGRHPKDRKTAKCGMLPDKSGRGYCEDFLDAVANGEYIREGDSWGLSGAVTNKAAQKVSEEVEFCPFCEGRVCPPLRKGA